MYITIDPNSVIKQVNNFWNHIHFHPTDAIEDRWGQNILDKVSEDKVAGTVRMYTMFEDIVSMDESGNLKYDFTLTDTRLDYMIKKGFNIMLCYNFIPPCISSDPTETSANAKNPTRYKGKVITTAPPKDYSLWEEICFEYTKHIVERYGIDRVAKWYLHCYNEPDQSGYFMKKAEKPIDRLPAYIKLYEGFAAAVEKVSEKLKIGGPVLAGDMEFYDAFLKHVKTKGLKIDFISVHCYGTTLSAITSGSRPLSIYNHLEKIVRLIGVCKKNNMTHLPLIVDEWGGSSMGFGNKDDCPGLIFRDNEIYSAYYVKMLTLFDHLDLPIEKMLICLSGQHEMKVDFSGFRNFFTLNGYPKPIYNAFALASKLGTEKLGFAGLNFDPLVSAFPTRHPDGHLSVLLAYSSQHFDYELNDLPINMRIEGFTGTHRYRKWVIDKNHSNSYSAYLSLGSPDNPTEQQKQQIINLGSNSFSEGEMSDTVDFTMTNNSVILIEIY